MIGKSCLFLISAANVAGLAGLLALGAGPVLAAVSEKYEKALAEALDGATPTKDMITLKMPEIAENGNVVAITVDASAAEAAGKAVTSLQVFATDNPWPFVATFHLSKLSGKAEVTSRMRLARSQKVVALAKLESGDYLMTETFVKVTIGGCGG